MSLVLSYDLSQADPNKYKQLVRYLDIIFGPPGEGKFAVSPGNPEGDNAPGQAVFYPNTVSGREEYARTALEHSLQGGNNYLSSALWATDRKRAPLTLDGDGTVAPLRFPTLWCDVDKDGYNQELLTRLKEQGCLINTSGGRRASGKPRFHIRVPLDKPLTNVDEFYKLNKWLAKALGGEKFAPVSWLTMPGTDRYKAEYKDGHSAVKVVHDSSLKHAWTVRELQRLFKEYCDPPEVESGAARADGGLTATAVDLKRKELYEIRAMLTQTDQGDGTSRYKQTNKLVKLCAEAGLSKDQALWVLGQHEPSVSKFGEYRLPGQVHACWPATKVEQKYEAPELMGQFDTHWLFEQTFPPVQWVVQDLIPEGLTILAADPKAGKSWLVLGLALACASGGKALGKIPVQKRPVLYMALEDPHRRIKDRIGKLIGVKTRPPKFAYQLQTEEPVEEMLAFAKANKNAFIIVDVLAEIKPEQERGTNTYAADYKYMRSLKVIPEEVPGTSVLIVHHTRKNAGEGASVGRVSGTQGQTGGVDGHMILTSEDGSKEGILTAKGRETGDWSIALVKAPGPEGDGLLWTLKGDDLRSSETTPAQRTARGAPMGENMAQLLEYMATTEGSVGVTEVMRDLGFDRSKASTYLYRAAENLHIERVGRGRYKIN